MTTLAANTFHAPHIDYKALSPLMATVAGSCVVLLVGLFRAHFVQRVLVPFLTLFTLGAAIALAVINWGVGDTKPIVAGALASDALSLGISILFYVAGIATVVLSLRSAAAREVGRGEYYSLLLGSISGMVVLASAENLVTLFVGLELLSIPLYVLCASRVRREGSLEAGLKYLIIGSLGSATLLYRLALIYGATGSTDLSRIAVAIGETVSTTAPLLLTRTAPAPLGI